MALRWLFSEDLRNIQRIDDLPIRTCSSKNIRRYARLCGNKVATESKEVKR